MTSSRLMAVGVFVLGGLLLFGVGLFVIGDRRLLFQESFVIYTEFANLAGLQNGARIRVAGINAGEVTEIQVPPSPAARFRVRLRVIQDLHPLVRTDSVASIQTDGLMGSKVLHISTGSEQAPEAPPLSTIPSQEPFEVGDLLEQISDTTVAVGRMVDEVQDELEAAFRAVGETAGIANAVVAEVGDDLKVVTASAQRISEDLQLVVADVRAGEGTLGRLVQDPELYNQLRQVAAEAEAITRNTREATEALKTMISEVETRGIVHEIEQTVQSARHLTDSAREALAGLRPKEDAEQPMGQDVRLTLQYVREATGNLADNMEALKRNFLFRGFFRDRGFYDLEALTVEDYRQGVLERNNRRALRHWVEAGELFSVEQGVERLTDEGRKRLDSVMAEFLGYPLNSPLVVEGYAGAGTPDENFLRSRRRAVLVREYLTATFHLDRRYTGFLAMGAPAPDSPAGDRWEGVALALFVDRSAQPR